MRRQIRKMGHCRRQNRGRPQYSSTTSAFHLPLRMMACLLLFLMFASCPLVLRAEEEEVTSSEGSSTGDGSGSTPGDDVEGDTTTTSTATATGEQQEASSGSSSESAPKAKTPETDPNLYADFDPSNTEWGTYYDPRNVFCGKYDCYKILGFDYESFGKNIPDTKIITKRYRALSREWHPDKSKHRHAKERFVKIARAYEVLTNKETRLEYDAMRYDIEKYYMKYGANVLWAYAPKSDTAIVVIILLVVGNVFSIFSQKHRWQLVADRLILAAVEDWSASQGGTPESKQLRDEALSILASREKEEAANKSNGTAIASSDSKSDNESSTTTSSKKQKLKKVSGKEKKKLEMEALKPVVTDIVYAMSDFGGGFHKPTWRDLLIVSLVRLPFKLACEIVWLSKYSARRLMKYPLTDDERLVLTQRAVGPLAWDTLATTEEERQALIKRELWIVANLAEWSEEQEFNKLSTGEKKEYMRMKKRGIVMPDSSLLKED